jgi:RNA polymerase sigma-70 factor, ECF subfamily
LDVHGGQSPLKITPSTALRYQQADPDVRLMLQVRDGDAAAFEQLVRRYQHRLVRLLEHLAPRPDQAEDLAQEVFLRVFRARERYQPGAKFSTWLFTIAGNVANNATRTIIRRKEVSEVDAPKKPGSRTGPLEAMAQAASGLMPARQADQLERSQMVREAIAKLSERQRMALVLNKFEGMNYAEIAETMALSTKAVKSLLARARVQLRELLTHYMDFDPKTIDPKTLNDDSQASIDRSTIG